MIEREIPTRCVSPIDRARMQSHGLIVRHTAPSPSITDQQLRVEAPGDDGVGDQIVVAVGVHTVGDGDEAAWTGGGVVPESSASETWGFEVSKLLTEAGDETLQESSLRTRLRRES